MAEVSIDLDAMDDLIASLDTARETVTGAAGRLRGQLERVELSTGTLAQVGYGGGVEHAIGEALRDLNRRRAIARMIEQATPGLAVVSFGDSVLSTTSDAEIAGLVDTVLGKLKVDEDDFDPRGVDPELLRILAENQNDPYFAQALASRVTPGALAAYLDLVNRGRVGAGLDGVAAFDRDYDALLRGLGMTLGLASQGTGDVAVPGMTKAWTDFAGDERLRFAHGGQLNLVSLVIERGLWSDDFLVDVYNTIRTSEGDGGAEQWAVGGPWLVTDPRPERSPECDLMQDPLYGILTAMQSNPDAVRRVFGTAETRTVDTGKSSVVVNAAMWEFLHGRPGLDELTAGAFALAVQSAILSPPKEGQDAFQPRLAGDLGAVAKALDEESDVAKEKAGPWWKQLLHGLLDVVGLVPVLGEPADVLSGVWYYTDGDWVNGSLSMGSAIPVLGYAAVGGKWVRTALKAEDLLELERLAEAGELITAVDRASGASRVFARDGRLLDEAADLADPANFAPEKFLSDAELKRWNGMSSFMRKIIAGNRFNAYANRAYDYSEIALETGRKSRFRLDAYTPDEAIVSRKLTQLNDVSVATAKTYIDEFVKKYPEGTKIANTKKNRDLGIVGDRLNGPMVLEVPPQVGGRVDPAIVAYAESKQIFIRDVNGTYYTKPPE
ncbi:hypothetical protein [Cellulomonas sp. URHE0023]|uniref:hypothetical protein n=1 Tax=Cellulomonas sp. URHE0023 TaxID=1380354 RepID=UPI0012DFC5CA|nr:hypothetical protein [Cellulomonas sp. URHE0023]